MSNTFSRLRIALRLARRDLAAHKIRTVVALLLFALPVSLVVGFASMVSGYDRAQDKSPINNVTSLSFTNQSGESHRSLTPAVVSEQGDELSAGIGDLADSLSATVLQTSEFSRGDRSIDLDVFTVAPSADGSGPEATPGTVYLNDRAAFFMDAEDGDTVTVDGSPLTVTVGAEYTGSVVSTEDVPVNQNIMSVSWSFPADQDETAKITSALTSEDSDLATSVSIGGRGEPGSISFGLDSFLVALSVFILGVLLVSAVITPVFAVAARRQRRAMGLMSATGSAPRDLRLVMLTEGLIVGVIGTVFGLLLSVGVALGLENLTPGATPYWSWPYAVAVSVVALICSVTSALVPALRAGKEDPVQALSDGGSVRMTGFRKRMLTGLIFLIPGVILTLTSNYEALTIGVALCGIGVVLSSSLLVWLMSRLGSRLPTAGRLAVRDSLRNNHRTVPAVGAIAGATFLAAAALTLPYDVPVWTDYKDNVAVVSSSQGGDETFYTEELRTISDRMGAREQHTTASAEDATRDGSTYHVNVRPNRDNAPDMYGYAMSPSDIQVTDGGVFGAYDGISEETVKIASDALSEGKAVVSSPDILHNGEVTLDLREYDPYYGYVPEYSDEDPGPPDDSLTVPAILVPGLADIGTVYGTAISPETAASLGLDTSYSETVLILDKPVTTLQAALAVTDLWPVSSQYVSVDTPAVNGERAIMFTVPVTLSWILTLGTLLLVVLLAATESRRDMATITAIGAAPGLLRRFSAAQAVFIALPGTLLGAVIGILPAVGQVLRELHGDPVFVTGFLTPSQWLALGLTAVVGPVLAWIAGSVIGAVTSRDRSPVRRH